MALAGAWTRERVHPQLLIESVAALKKDPGPFQGVLACADRTGRVREIPNELEVFAGKGASQKGSSQGKPRSCHRYGGRVGPPRNEKLEH